MILAFLALPAAEAHPAKMKTGLVSWSVGGRYRLEACATLPQKISGAPSKKNLDKPNLSDKFGFMHPPVKNTFRGLFCAAIALVLCSQLPPRPRTLSI